MEGEEEMGTRKAKGERISKGEEMEREGRDRARMKVKEGEKKGGRDWDGAPHILRL